MDELNDGDVAQEIPWPPFHGYEVQRYEEGHNWVFDSFYPAAERARAEEAAEILAMVFATRTRLVWRVKGGDVA